MATSRVKLMAAHLNTAREMVSKGSGDGTIFADEKTDGLILRVRKTAAAFSLKYAGKTRLLGTLSENEKGPVRSGEIQTVQAARDLADKVRALLKDGTDPTAFLSGKVAGKNDMEAKVAAERQTLIASGRWTWERLVEEYTDGYLGKPRKVKKRIRQPSPQSVEQAKRSLTPPEADWLKGLLVSELDASHMEGVRDDCVKRPDGGKTASRSFVMYAKSAMSFAKKKHRTKAGLDGVKRWWLEIEILDETAVEARTRMPSVEDIAKTLYTAEKHRILDGRKNARGTSETVICGLWWLALTGQRSGAGFALEKAHILPWPEGPGGWKVATWTETVMKSKRLHALPIPPRIVLLLERAMATGSDKESKYAFPATSKRTGKGDVHLSKSAPKNLLSRLRGNAITLRRSKKEIEAQNLPDLLKDIDHFSMHDMRRTFATTCSDMAIRGDAISAALDHAGLETGQEMMRSADITRLAYDYSQRLELKRIAVEAWTNRLFEACDKAWSEELHKPRSMGDSIRLQTEKLQRLGLDLSKGVPFSESEPWYVTMERLKRSQKPRKLMLKKSAPQEFDDFEDFSA